MAVGPEYRHFALPKAPRSEGLNPVQFTEVKVSDLAAGTCQYLVEYSWPNPARMNVFVSDDYCLFGFCLLVDRPSSLVIEAGVYDPRVPVQWRTFEAFPLLPMGGFTDLVQFNMLSGKFLPFSTFRVKICNDDPQEVLDAEGHLYQRGLR